MSLKADNKELLRVIDVLFQSTYDHSMRQIHRTSNKRIYTRAFKKSYLLFQTIENDEDIRALIWRLLYLRSIANTIIKSKFELFNNSKLCYITAINHAIDIVCSVYARFQCGYPLDNSKLPIPLLRDIM